MTIILNIVTICIVGIGVYYYLKNLKFQRDLEDHYCKRFVETTTKIYIYPDKIEEEHYEVEDPVLRKALGVDKKIKPLSKEVSVRTTIDLEQVYNYTEWTSGNYDQQTHSSDCVTVYFNNGDSLIIFEKYDVFQTYHENYLNIKLAL